MTGLRSMFLHLATVCSGILLLAALAGPVPASSRVALVIGNAAYDHVPILANPLNDARDVAAVLGEIGFEVTRLENADYTTLRRGLRAFRYKASAADIALVFYAGHGIEMNKQNFLVPVDARLRTDGDVEFEAVPLDLVMAAVDGASDFRVVMLDACRENPFLQSMQRKKGATRSIGRGLARVETGVGSTLISYSAKEGMVALDGEGRRNSPYTEALLRVLPEPGLEVGIMFRQVREMVLEATGGNQEPFIYAALPSKGAFFIPSGDPDAGSGISASAHPGATATAVTDDATAVAALSSEVERVARDPVIGEEFSDCPQCPWMVVIPAGSYEMGSPSGKAVRSEARAHRVTIARPIAVGKYEIRRGEFTRFMEESRRSDDSACWQYDGATRKPGSGATDPGFPQAEDEPMVCVSWGDAQAYVEWLSRTTRKRYRLLSESEWEYAARGGAGTSPGTEPDGSEQCASANGADESVKAQYAAWFGGTASCDDGHAHTAEAGRFRANGFGLYDMLGNAREWVQDCWRSDYDGAPDDGSAWTGGGSCGLRVLRGGSWLDGPGGIHLSARDRAVTSIRYAANGFRVARELD